MGRTHIQITCRRAPQGNGRCLSGPERSSFVVHRPLGHSALGGLLLPNRHITLNSRLHKSTTARSMSEGGEDSGENRHRVAPSTNTGPGEEPPRVSAQSLRLEKKKGTHAAYSCNVCCSQGLSLTAHTDVTRLVGGGPQ